MKVEVESLNELVRRLENENNKCTSKLYEANQTIDSLRTEVSQLKKNPSSTSLKSDEEDFN